MVPNDNVGGAGAIKGYDKLQDADNLKGDEQLEGLTVVTGVPSVNFQPFLSLMVYWVASALASMDSATSLDGGESGGHLRH